jgi:hypothetical protein
VTGEAAVGDDIIIVSYKLKDDLQASPGKTNVCIASFVTSYARLRLYEEMEKIEAFREGRVLYFDTDSIIFSTKEGEYSPSIGDYLGQMTDEIAEYGPGASIIKFVSGGPKNYAYVVAKPDGTQHTVIKAKGLRLHTSALDVLSFEEMINSVAAYMRKEQLSLKVPQYHIRSKRDHVVCTKFFDKLYKIVADKRRTITCSLTRPFGYVDT